ncbi:hypothetical protein LTR84_000409 [Exophiala bonariae]|uniref:Acyltransferase 3 domain-containing protein n=1 Tax=Exophiala bonariae TaxID=1690606 RepID=A0AAV9NRK8_9EURO|nr:hypothetical protein LTR84_000409 [Exophiala bonariae]
MDHHDKPSVATNNPHWRITTSQLLSTVRDLRGSRVTGILESAVPTALSKSIRSRILEDPISSSGLKTNIGPTTWMDGLRGCAALVVFNYHFLFAFTDSTAVGFGVNEQHHSIIELPFIRLLYDGATCVNIFFVIAGYVCSAKALQLMTTAPSNSSGNRHEKVLSSLSCSVFRRFARLYLPVMCMMFITTVSAYAGLFEGLRDMIAQKDVNFRPQFTEPSVRQCATLTQQLHFWLQELYKLSDVWRVGPFYPEHDPHLWTIGYEARMSMHLYIALVGLAKCKPRVRLGFLIALALLYTIWNRWEGPLFFLGAALAQYDALKHASGAVRLDPSPTDLLPGSPSTTQSSCKPSSAGRILRRAAYTFALYLMSYPISGFKKPAPGFTWMNNLIPAFYSRKEKFPKSIGVLLFVFLLQTSRNHIASPTPSFWHRLFTCRFARYLGQHMFALYLVHGTVLHIVGYGIPHFVWGFTGKDGAAGWLAGVVVGWVCSLVLCLFFAEVFTRQVDGRCASVIRRLENFCMQE